MCAQQLVTYKIPSRQTGGAYALFEVTTQPGAGPPPHVQHREDESIYVLEGDYKFLIGSEALRVEAGSLLYVPKGTLHSHKNVGERVGRMLLTQTPAGLYERFFDEVGEPADVGGQLAFGEQPEAKEIVKIAAEHGIEIPAPSHRVVERECDRLRAGHPHFSLFPDRAQRNRRGVIRGLLIPL